MIQVKHQASKCLVFCFINTYVFIVMKTLLSFILTSYKMCDIIVVIINIILFIGGDSSNEIKH